MVSFRYEILAAWKEVRWTVYFLVLLFPACLIATGLAAGVQGTPSPSPGWLFAFGAPMALLALIGAGLWDGVMGRLGRYIWWPLLIWFALVLLKAYFSRPASEAAAEPLIETAAPKCRTPWNRAALQKTAEWLRDQGITWREVGRLRAQLAKGSADPRVRELRQVLGV